MKHFPDTQRAFADGELAVLMDRYGGLLDIALINVLHRPERDYPDNCYLPVLTRKAGMTIGRPLSGPAIQLLTECQDDMVLHHTVLEPDIHPWGVFGDTLDMVLDRRRIFLKARCKAAGRSRLRFVISQPHLLRGEWRSVKNQRIKDGCPQHCERAGVPFDPDFPVRNAPCVVSWLEPEFLSARNALLFEGTLAYPYGTEKLFIAISCQSPLEYRKMRNIWVLTAPWEATQEAMELCVAFDSERETALDRCTQSGTLEDIAAAKLARDERLVRNATSVEVEGMPLAGQFARVAVPYQDSLLLHDTVAIRAAQYKYACFMMWDSLYPIRDLLWHGDYDTAVALYRSFVDYPWIENSAWCVSQLFLTLDEILSFRDNLPLLQALLPFLKRCLDFQLRLTNSKTGFVASFMNVGVDVPEELGLHGLYNAPCINGWWYGALRTAENWAIRLEDETLQGQVSPLISRIEQNYLNAFQSPRNGALRSGVNEDFSVGEVEAFQNTSTIPLDYPYGQYLLRKALPALEHYHSCQLRHPAGYTALAWNTEVMCEAWKSVHMNQHLGHEARLARMTGNSPEARRLVGECLEFCHEYRNAIETFNYSGCPGNETQTGDWQTFGCTGISEAIRAGLVGIVRHAGGLRYLPAMDERLAALRNIPWENKRIDLEISGCGPYLDRLEIDGVPCLGTAQLPVDCLQTENAKVHCRILRSETLPPYPILLQACGAAVSQVTVEGNNLTFTVVHAGHFPLQFLARKEVALTVNGQSVGATSDGWRDLTLPGGAVVTAVVE